MGVSCKTAFLMASRKVEAADHGDGRSIVAHAEGSKKIVAAGSVAMDRSALTPIGPLPSRDAVSKAPRAAGYRGSDFVRCRVARRTFTPGRSQNRA